MKSILLVLFGVLLGQVASNYDEPIIRSALAMAGYIHVAGIVVPEDPPALRPFPEGHDYYPPQE